ncbi:hypothetical protein P4H66_06165 [Paenibacillus dokdonensis]|uniref:Uncharacterized protein n=1 Tax=Paenibacillus dokdonensis TaxID=2567944 RepID=A0ABU6GI64_9BACL|nr:hypothetical protein [Paenibacillus dokdonensis]MEC0239439.1 hypothetical protein [Paenibacillus dokdonensis]
MKSHTFFELQRRLIYIDVMLEISSNDLFSGQLGSEEFKKISNEKDQLEKEISNRLKFSHLSFVGEVVTR